MRGNVSNQTVLILSIVSNINCCLSDMRKNIEPLSNYLLPHIFSNGLSSNPLTKPNRKPVDHLHVRDKAIPKAKFTEASSLISRNIEHKTFVTRFSDINSELLTNSDRKPVDYLNKRDKANPETKSTDAAKPGYEVQPSHLGRSLKL